MDNLDKNVFKVFLKIYAKQNFKADSFEKCISTCWKINKKCKSENDTAFQYGHAN